MQFNLLAHQVLMVKELIHSRSLIGIELEAFLDEIHSRHILDQ
jgi:hypothetical protein